MKYFSVLLKHFISASTSLQFYQALKFKPLKPILKYVIAISGVQSLMLMIILTLKLVPYLNLIAADKPEEMAKLLPQSITITLHQGELVVNAAKTVYMPLARLKKAAWFQLTHPQLKNILVIDPETTAADAIRLQTIILLTHDQLVIPAGTLPLILPLSVFPDLVVNQALFTSWITALQHFYPWFYLLLIPLFVLVWFLFIGLIFLVSFIISLVTWLLARVFASSVSLIHNLKINLYLSLSLSASLFITRIIGSLFILIPLTLLTLFLVNLILQLTLTEKNQN